MEEEETVIELEALRFTYADDLTVLQEHPLSVKIAIAPYTGAGMLFRISIDLSNVSICVTWKLRCSVLAGDDSAKQFVAADLVLEAGKGYPERPPDISLQEVKGTDHEQPPNIALYSGSTCRMMLGMQCDSQYHGTALRVPTPVTSPS